MFSRSLLNWMILVAGLWSAGPASSAIDLAFGVYVSDKPTEMITKFRPMLDALEAKLSRSLGENVSIRLKVARSYAKGRRQLVEGKVDLSRFGAVSYVLAKDEQPDIQILATESKDGDLFFNGIIAVPGGSPVTRVEQLRGKSFAFGDETSTIGRYLSQLYLLEHGITAKDLAVYQYLGRHDKVGTMVAAGRFDAGALKEGTFNKLIGKGKNLRVLAKFPVPTKPWLARAGLPEKIRHAITDALLNFKDKKALQALKLEGFLASDDGHYDMVRSAIRRNTEFFK